MTFTSELESPAYSASHIYMLNDNNEYYEFTELVIPEGVTEIGNYQFYGFSNVTNIVVPNSVTRIGFSAFRGCDVLESITLPFVGNTLDGDANNHFKYVFGAFNSSDTSVVLPETFKEVVITNATVIGYSAFDDCNLITTITLLESVKTIESLAFSGCSSLVTVNMTDNITSIGSFAFKNCTSLETIKLPASIEILKSELFTNCTSLTKVEIPEGVKKIEFRAFSGCNSLETLVIPSTVTNIEYNALEGLNSIKSLTIPFVGENADGSGAFNFGCIFGGSNETYVPITLKEVIISNTTVIESYSFFGCNNIESVVILEGTTKINSIAFANCNSLKSITLPSSLESIGSESFINCPLENVYYMGTVEQWNNITIDQHETTIVKTNITYNYVIEE